METLIVRIDHIALTNMKSVVSGEIDFQARDAILALKSSVMGIYGQNASGKTTVVEAIALLREILSGKRVSPNFLSMISCGKRECELEVVFSIVASDEKTNCNAIYHCVLSETDNPNEDDAKIVQISAESLKFSGVVNEKPYVFQTIVETDTFNNLVRPDSKRRTLFGSDKKLLDLLRLEKVLALRESRSFLFSLSVLDKILDTAEVAPYLLVLKALRVFAHEKLFVITENDYGMQKMLFHNNKLGRTGYMDGLRLWIHGRFFGNLPVPLSGEAYADPFLYGLLQQTIRKINPVLESLVPGLNIAVENIRQRAGEKDQTEYAFELFSDRKGCGQFPLRMESQGVRKIISILSLLIGVHNDPQICLVVDELDSGVFEYLLGELMREMRDAGKGQLIFTSHNLRPLELLNWKSVCFTTNNPQNRFVKQQVKKSNNLRDVYYRTIGLGGADESLYDGANSSDIGYKFRSAGYDK